MNPLYRCRSDPQIAVDVIFTIASRGFSSFGIGTSSTRMSCLPYQQIAFMCRSLLRLVGAASRAALRARSLSDAFAQPIVVATGRAARAAGGLAFRARDLAGLEQLLDAKQGDLGLFPWRYAEQLRDRFAGSSARQLVVELDANDGASIRRRALEAHAPRARHVSAGQRSPCDQRARLLVDDLGIPLDPVSRRTFCDPMRAPVFSDVDGLELRHEAREV